MTAKNVKRPSLPMDTYFTPPWLARQCCEIVLPEVCEPHLILEPSAGQGVFLECLREAYPSAALYGLDVDPGQYEWPCEGLRGDFLGPDSVEALSALAQRHGVDRFDLIIGNPPYTFALEFIERSLALADNVVFLLRQGFLSSARRHGFFQEHCPSHVFIVPHRPSFTGDNRTDSADYCVVAWMRGVGAPTTLHWLPLVPKEIRRG